MGLIQQSHETIRKAKKLSEEAKRKVEEELKVYMNFVWVFGWFVVGLVTFQIKGIKSFFGGVGSLFSLLSLFLLIQGQSSLASIIEFIGIGKISGVFTLIAYLIGANISRYAQFGKMSPRIIIYIILFFMLWILLETLF